MELLEEIVSDHDRTWVGGAVIWQKALLDLAKIYLEEGQVKEAASHLNEMTEMLQFADPDHPILRQLQQPPLAGLIAHQR